MAKAKRPYCPLHDGECLGSGCAWSVLDPDTDGALICAVALMAAESGQRVLEHPKRREPEE